MPEDICCLSGGGWEAEVGREGTGREPGKGICICGCWKYLNGEI
jgi:hypothetical protein